MGNSVALMKEGAFLRLRAVELLTDEVHRDAPAIPGFPERLCPLPDATLPRTWPTCLFGLTVGQERHVSGCTCPLLDPLSPPILRPPSPPPIVWFSPSFPGLTSSIRGIDIPLRQTNRGKNKPTTDRESSINSWEAGFSTVLLEEHPKRLPRNSPGSEQDQR